MPPHPTSMKQRIKMAPQRLYSPLKSKVSQKCGMSLDWSSIAMNQDQICSTSFLRAASTPSCRLLWIFWKRSTILTRERRQLHRGWFSKVVALIRARVCSFSSSMVRALPVCPIAYSNSPHNTSSSAKMKPCSAFTQWWTAFRAFSTPPPAPSLLPHASLRTCSQWRRLNSMLLRSPQSSITFAGKMQCVGFSGRQTRLKIRHAFTPWLFFRKAKLMFSRMTSGSNCAPLLRTASSTNRSMLLREIFSAGRQNNSRVSQRNYWMKSPCQNSMIFFIPRRVRSIEERIRSCWRIARHFPVMPSSSEQISDQRWRFVSNPSPCPCPSCTRQGTTMARSGFWAYLGVNLQSDLRLRTPVTSGYILKGFSCSTLRKVTEGRIMPASLLLIVWYFPFLAAKKGFLASWPCRASRQAQRGANCQWMAMKRRQF